MRRKQKQKRKNKRWRTTHEALTDMVFPEKRYEAEIEAWKNPVPIITGAAGLTGRPQVRPVDVDLIQPLGYDEEGRPFYAEPPAEGPAIPGRCLRLLNSPNPLILGGCGGDCPGLQRDGTCLAEVVRECQRQGREWKFEIDPEGYWTLV